MLNKKTNYFINGDIKSVLTLVKGYVKYDLVIYDSYIDKNDGNIEFKITSLFETLNKDGVLVIIGNDKITATAKKLYNNTDTMSVYMPCRLTQQKKEICTVSFYTKRTFLLPPTEVLSSCIHNSNENDINPEIIKNLLTVFTNEQSKVFICFFSEGNTAEIVYQFNFKDKGNRKFTIIGNEDAYQRVLLLNKIYGCKCMQIIIES